MEPKEIAEALGLKNATELYELMGTDINKASYYRRKNPDQLKMMITQAICDRYQVDHATLIDLIKAAQRFRSP